MGLLNARAYTGHCRYQPDIWWCDAKYHELDSPIQNSHFSPWSRSLKLTFSKHLEILHHETEITPHHPMITHTIDSFESFSFTNGLGDVKKSKSLIKSLRAYIILLLPWDYICTKIEMIPVNSVEVIEQTRIRLQTDRRTDRRTNRRIWWNQYTPTNVVQAVSSRGLSTSIYH